MTIEYKGAAVSTMVRLDAVLAVLIGVSLPLLVFGRAATQGAVALVLVMSLAVAWRTRQAPIDLTRCRAIVIACLAVAVCWLPSIAVSLDPSQSATTFARTLLAVATGLLAWTALGRTEGGLALAMKSFLALGAVLSLGSVVAVLGLGTASHFAIGLKSKASAFIVMLPLVVLAGMRLGQNWKWVAAASGTGTLGMVAVTASKSSLAALAAASILVVGLYAVRRRRWWLVAVGLAGAVASVIAVTYATAAFNATDAGFEPYLPPLLVDMHRQAIWQFAFERFLDRPALGWGINAVNQTPGAGDLVPGMLQEFIPAHPHSWVVEILSETGLVGFVPLVLVLGWAFMRLALRYFRSGDKAALAGFSVLTTFWAAAAFNFSIWAIWWELVLIITLAITVARPHPDTRNR